MIWCAQVGKAVFTGFVGIQSIWKQLLTKQTSIEQTKLVNEEVSQRTALKVMSTVKVILGGSNDGAVESVIASAVIEKRSGVERTDTHGLRYLSSLKNGAMRPEYEGAAA